MQTPRKIPENYIATDVDDEIVLIDMAGGELFSLRGAARQIWDLIDGTNTSEEIVAILMSAYDVQAAQAEHDLGELLAELSGAGLVSC